jgi:hypothetical protein
MITQYSPCLLLHNIYIAHTMNQMPLKLLLPVLPSVLLSVCWINETTSNLIPFITIFNLGNKSHPALNQGSRVDGITRGSLISPKT